MEPTEPSASSTDDVDSDITDPELEYLRYTSELGRLGVSPKDAATYHGLGLSFDMVTKLIKLGRLIAAQSPTWLHNLSVKVGDNSYEAAETALAMTEYWGIVAAHKTLRVAFAGYTGTERLELIPAAGALSTILRMMDIADVFRAWKIATPSPLDAELDALELLMDAYETNMRDRLQQIVPHAFASDTTTGTDADE